jgi:hypothetical protein
MEAWQIALAALGIIGALCGVIYWAGQSRDDKQDERAERMEERIEKVERDIGEHGHAIARLDERTETERREIGKLRDMRHEIIEQCSRSISEFYTDSVKRITELREWVVERMK